MRIGVTGPFLLAKAVIPLMVKQGGGAFVHISSITTVSVMPGMTAYAPSKAALEALSNQIAIDYGSDGIRSNCVRAGMFRVGASAKNHDDPEMGSRMRSIQMLDLMGVPEHIASAVSFLASEDAAFVTGSIVTADAGVSIKSTMPDTAAQYAARKGSENRSSS